MAGAVDAFIAMLAAERGAAMNTRAAYARDLEGARELIGPLESASAADLASLGGHWADLAPSSLARKCSALRQFYGFLIDEGLRQDDPTPAFPGLLPAAPCRACWGMAMWPRCSIAPRQKPRATGPSPCARWLRLKCSMARACARPSW